ncbi:glycosyltransferase family 2 protein [Priestia koreensis]|uniref:glycosyltransferase family 2 protein n=1 Tax=Priestia koreensis TaxID=284581 RepID=UPI001F585164|nr:glycosyltransferase [Priestia koreensis]UNL85659.1 glycosyltransferase family 2 protein [Priestia koreensis]
MVHTFLQIIMYVILIYTLIVISTYSVMFMISFFYVRRLRDLHPKNPYDVLVETTFTKPISILVPAYNEEKGIIGSVSSLLSIQYPEYEVIVVNDGSRDQTLETLIDHFELILIDHEYKPELQTKSVHAVYHSKLNPALYVVDKENGGKADALNVGINLSHFPYVCAIDADSVLERDAFLKVMKPILDEDEEVVAIGGSVRIANGCRIEGGEVMEIGLSKSPLVILQVIEYLRAFLMGRIGLSRNNLLLIVSGAFGVFSKKWVKVVGGYAETVGEDMELIVRLHRYICEEKLNLKIVYIPEPVCWTEAPESLSILRKQRTRWQRGLFESLWMHKKMIGNPHYGKIGLVSIPYFVFIELLGPIIEMMGYLLLIVFLIMGNLYVDFAIKLLLLNVLYGSILSAFAVTLEEWSFRKYPKLTHIWKLFLYSFTESFWYRPLTVIWRCEGLLQVLFRKKGWGDMVRKGVSS